MTIRRFTKEDAPAVAALIAETLRTTNSRDYSSGEIEATVQFLTPEKLTERAGWMHFYVVCDAEHIIGCGGIGPYWGKENESSLFTIFVHPSCQGKGIGRRIMETLEQDAFFLRAKRIEVPSSITAVAFYQRMGYDYKNGVAALDEERHYPLEKYREPKGC